MVWDQSSSAFGVHGVWGLWGLGFRDQRFYTEPGCAADASIGRKAGTTRVVLHFLQASGGYKQPKGPGMIIEKPLLS